MFVVWLPKRGYVIQDEPELSSVSTQVFSCAGIVYMYILALSQINPSISVQIRPIFQ